MRSDVLNKNSNAWDGKSRAETLLEWNYINCGSPIVSANSNGATGVSADGDRASMLMPGENGQLFYTDICRIGAFTAVGQPPRVEGTIPSVDTASTAAGLNMQGDHDTATDLGWEMTLGSPFGGLSSSFIAQTHSGYIDATFFCADWTDYDAVSIGFRKAEAFNTGHAAVIAAASGDPLYTDFATFGVQSADDIQSATDLNNGGSGVYTDSGQAVTDSQNHRLRINLASDGKVTYKHIGNAVAGAGVLAAPSSTVAFTFDSGDELIPYVICHGGAGHVDRPLFLKDIKVVRTPSRDGHSVA